MRQSIARAAYRLGFLGAVAGIFFGCSSHPMPSWNLASAGWSLSQHPTVWRTREGGPELVGELLVARREDGSRLVQFSKQGIPMIVARVDPGGWEIESPFEGSRHSGRGKPPARAVWFQIHGFPPGPTACPPWEIQRSIEGSWILQDRSRGERLEVVP